jgi:hydroxymethylbilane synthase
LPSRSGASDDETRGIVRRLRSASGAALRAERTLVEALGGGCQLPLGGIAVLTATVSRCRVVMSLDGRRVIRAHGSGSTADPDALGRRVAEDLAASGAAEILEEVRRGQ